MKNYYTYNFQEGERTLPHREVSIFEGEEIRLLITEAGKEMAKFPSRNRPILPAVFGHKTKEKKWENDKLAWAENEKKPFILDFASVRYMMLSGVQGGGKSNALHQLILSLMYFTPKELLNVHILDKKSDAKVYSSIANVVTNENEILRYIKKMKYLAKKKQDFLSKIGHSKIGDYNANVGIGKKYKKVLPYDVIVIDEFASTTEGCDDAKKASIDIMETGRSAGVFLILTGQRLDAKVSGGAKFGGRAKANILHNWSFAQRDGSNSVIAGVDSSAKGLPVGHSIIRTPKSDFYVETALITSSALQSSVNNFQKLKYDFKN